MQRNNAAMRRPVLTWWIALLGLLVSLTTLAIGIYGLVADPDRDSEVVSRLGFGLLISGITFLPYGLLWLAARRTGLGLAALIVAVVCFGLDIALRTGLVFFPQSSTDAVALLFFLFWLAAVALVAWAILEVWNYVSRNIGS
jgi:hypothetical protein